MSLIILAAGFHALERDIRDQCYAERHSVCLPFMNIPKPLLYIHHRACLSYLYEGLGIAAGRSNTFLMTDAIK